jgi:hypothetical protein
MGEVCYRPWSVSWCSHYRTARFEAENVLIASYLRQDVPEVGTGRAAAKMNKKNVHNVINWDHMSKSCGNKPNIIGENFPHGLGKFVS